MPAPSTAGAGDARLAKTGDVPVGGVWSPRTGVLVMQLSEGKFSAFSAICPHQNWRLTPPDAKGVIACGAHQPHFRAADGARIDGPGAERPEGRRCRGEGRVRR